MLLWLSVVHVESYSQWLCIISDIESPLSQVDIAIPSVSAALVDVVKISDPEK